MDAILTNSIGAVAAHYDRQLESGAMQESEPEYQLFLAQINDDMTAVRVLQKSMKIEPTKRMSFRNSRNRILQAVFSEPLGKFYQQLAIEYGAWLSKEVMNAWTFSPISTLEVFNIPINTDASEIRSFRLINVSTMTIGFNVHCDWHQVRKFLVTLAFKGGLLRLKNVTATPEQLAFFKRQYDLTYNLELA